MRGSQSYGNFKVVPALNPISATAGSSPDNVEQTGLTVDLAGANDCTLVISGRATLQEGQTLSIVNVDIRESADDSTYETAVNLVATDQVVATGPSGDGTVDFCYHLPIDMQNETTRKQYVQFDITFDIDTANTDTVILSAVAVLGGLQDRGLAKNELTA